MVIRKIEATDLEACRRLMTSVGAAVAGLRGRAIYKAVCCDALAIDKIVFLVAEKEDSLAGYVIAALDWRTYWRTFFFKHPLLAMQILVSRFRKLLSGYFRSSRLGIGTALPKGVGEQGATGRSWGESSPGIAKIIHIGVGMDYRGAGIGEELYLRLFDELIKQGIHRIDAMVSSRNTSSIRMHQSTGWTLEMARSAFLFATRDLA